MNKTPQAGIFNEGLHHIYFLEYKIDDNKITDDIKKILKQCLANNHKVYTVIGFGKKAWHSLNPNWEPATLEDFTDINGIDDHQAFSTQADIFFWLQGSDISNVYDQALDIHKKLGLKAQLVLDERGFEYHNSMDLIQFEDGTSNPKTNKLKYEAAIIPKGLAGDGGSLVLSQKWIHNLSKWEQETDEQQGKIIGRTKYKNIELEGNSMPCDSHISRTDLKINEVDMKIYRRSAPFGNMTEKGLMFLAFACNLERLTSQIDSMYGLTDDKITDKLLNYSISTTNSYWFAPAIEDLEQALS